MKTWAVWFAEYPDDGSIDVEAETRDEAMLTGADLLEANGPELSCSLIPEPDYSMGEPAPTGELSPIEDKSKGIADVVRANREGRR